MERRAVPSFASFKPKKSGTPADQGKDDDGERDRSSRRRREDDDTRRRRKHSSHGHRHRSRDRDRRRGSEVPRQDRERESRHSLPDQQHDRPSTPVLVQDEVQDSEYFMVDRRGDSKNNEYGGLHRYSIPAYLRVGYGNVLGADARSKIDREASTEKGITFRLDRGKPGKRAERLLANKNAKHERKSQRLILPQLRAETAEEPASLNLDFLALRPTLKRKRGSESPERALAGVDYRSIEGKAKPELQRQDHDAESEISSDELQEDIAADAQMRAKNAALSRAAKTDPQNVSVWLALLQHQSLVTFPSIDQDNLNSSQRRSAAEIRLAVLDQAFKHISPKDAGHDRLMLVYITEGSMVWEASRLAQKWKDAVRQDSKSTSLWQEYLSYLQTDHTTFRYDECKKSYLECIETLSKQHSVAKPEEIFVFVLLRFTKFASDAGYDELAMAIWQAMLEYHLFAPEFSDVRAKLDGFEEFWESDIPRIGEDAAQGWRQFATAGGATSRTAVRTNWPALDSRRPFASFTTTEQLLNKTLFLPAVTADEEDESDDPFRYVMFSDIKPILEQSPAQVDIRLLIDAFLCFLHLPLVGQASTCTREWASDVFLQNDATSPGPPHGRSVRYDSVFLFHNAFEHCSTDEHRKFVHRTLAACSTALPEYEELGEYFFAFVSEAAPAEAMRTAKQLLRTRPTSLRYYNAYALREAGAPPAADRCSRAVSIWAKALDLSVTLADDGREDAILLWHSWIATLLHWGDTKRALNLLLMMPDGNKAVLQATTVIPSPGAVLRARRHLDEGLDCMILKRKAAHAAIYGDCLAWLLYLSADHDIAAALRSFALTSAIFARGDNWHALELLHEYKARLLGQHMTARRPFKPTIFRDELAESRRLFPENSFILKQYYEVAKLTRLDDRIRDALSEASESSVSSQGLISWVCAIDAEIDRCSIDGASATQASVRALFRRALLAPDSRVKSSLLLWKKWLDFEATSLHRLADSKSRLREDAVRRSKEVFFDGIRFLPWSKAWVVEGMAVFADSGDMSEDQLQQIHDILVERELRVRVNVDELERCP